MLEKGYTEIIDKNKFLIHFIDKQKDKITPDQFDEIYNYQTDDGSEFKMAIRNNAMPKSILIDIKIEYPPSFYYPNYYERIDANEKRFQDFYNEIMNYNQSMSYEAGAKSEAMDSESK